MTLLSRVFAIAVSMCGALAAQDLTGRWVGVADTTDEAGTRRQERQTLEIRSEDGKLTGNTINRAGKTGFPFLVGTFSALHDSPKKWIYDRIGAMTARKADPSEPAPPPAVTK
jgi:hypothetical protein